MSHGDHWAAEAIEIVLRRAHPDAVEKGELSDQTGLTTDDLRAGLEALHAAGKLEDGGDGFRLRTGLPETPPAAAADDAEAPDPPDPEEREGRASVASTAAALPAPGSGPSYRATYEVTISFSGARGGNRDEVARRDARALEERVADVIAEGLGIGVVVELRGLEAFDSPRVVAIEDGGADGEGDER